jgi:hypothetical protein
MLIKTYVKNNESQKLIVHTMTKTYVYNTTTIEFEDITDSDLTGDEDNNFCACVCNDYYVFSNGIIPLKYWDMSASTIDSLSGATTLACKSMLMFGERLNLYHLPDLPRRVAWTVAGGLSIPPVAGDWSNAGSGDTDLDGVFGEDVIQCAHRLGNYVAIYGKDTIVLQEYANNATNPFNFYTRVAGKGTPSERGVANLGNEHIVLGWDDIFLYRGSTYVESIGDKVSDEIFTIISPQYISRSFVVYLNEQDEVRVYFPLIGSTTPNCYFTYSLKNKSWSRGTRSYTASGAYVKKESETWHTFGARVATWDTAVGRWNDVIQEVTAPSNLYGNTVGNVFEDLENTYNLVGVAIDGKWETKDLTASDRYRGDVVNWREVNFEASGHTLSISYSSDLGSTWSTPYSITLESAWKMYHYEVNVNSPQIRFRFRNSTVDETFELRHVEVGYVVASDRGGG